MSNIKISQLPAATTPDGTELLPLVQGSTTKRVALSSLLADGDGAAWVGFIQSGTGAQTRTAQAKMRETVSVKDFGAVGDGVTDDTAAIVALKNYVNAQGGGFVLWPKGTYYIAQTGAPNTVNIEFTDCDGLTFVFDAGAEISLKADFVHSASLTSSNIVFRRCKNVLLENVKTNGNVSTGTKVGTEQGEHGLQFFGCQNVTLINPVLHDHPNDGLYIDHQFTAGVISTESRNFAVINLDSYNNGRQGCSIIGLFNGTFINCRFRDTGNTGSFGSYAPGAGLDIEPNVTTGVVVRQLKFVNPRITGNGGSIFACINLASPTYPSIASTGNVDDIVFENPYFEVGASASGSDQIIFAVKNGSITGGTTRLTTGAATNPRITPLYSDMLSTVSIKDHVVYGKNQSLLAVKDASRSIYDQQVIIRDCSFVNENSVSNGGAIMLQMDCGGEFISNQVYCPSAAYSTGAATRELVRARKLNVVSGNVYTTNMTTAGQQFVVDYTDAVVVENETYPNQTYFWAKNDAGAALSPLYGRGQNAPGMQMTLYDYRGSAASNLYSRQFASYTVPTSGTWERGDIVWHSQPSAGGNIGWVCTSAGTPGTWKTFGTIAV
jgi:hypothetical protein